MKIGQSFTLKVATKSWIQYQRPSPKSFRRIFVATLRQGSKNKDVYESKTSLASRIVNVERMVDSIEEKLQVFIELYQEDRKRFMPNQQNSESIYNFDEEPMSENQMMPISDNEANPETFDIGNETESAEGEETTDNGSPDPDTAVHAPCAPTFERSLSVNCQTSETPNTPNNTFTTLSQVGWVNRVNLFIVKIVGLSSNLQY